MKHTLYLDLETRCRLNLKKVSIYRYAEEAEVTIFAYAWDDDPVYVWDCVSRGTTPKNLAKGIREYSKDGGFEVCAHNSLFDRVVLQYNKLLMKLEPLYTIAHRCYWRDTTVKARAHSLPGKLADLCTLYKIPEDQAKLKRGKSLVQLFCKPIYNGKYATRETHPKEWAEYIAYARNDIVSMRILDKSIPSWNLTPDEKRYWQLDQKINDRGFKIDTVLLENAIDIINKEKKRIDTDTQKKTHDRLSSANQRDAFLKETFKSYGVSLPDLKKATVERRLNDPDTPEALKELLFLRVQSSTTSLSKYKRVKETMNSDSVLRGTLAMYGAPRTGRWAGRNFQPQNLPRPKFKQNSVDFAIKLLRAGDYELLQTFFPSVNEVCSSVIRGLIVARKGKKLNVSDLSSIEGRALAYLAHEDWKIQAYRDLDIGVGCGLYELAYAKAFNIDPDSVNKDQRAVGKVVELGLGYQGGVGAFIVFAEVYKVNLDELAANTWDNIPQYTKDQAREWYNKSKEQNRTYGLSEKTFIVCDSIKRIWRGNNPKIVQFWYDVQDAFYRAVQGVRSEVNGLIFDKRNNWVRIRLPSGRFLCYPGAKAEDRQLSYLGLNNYKWCRIYTHGGKIAENITQSFSRDILAFGMINAENAGYKILLDVHDEIIAETEDNKDFSAQKLSKIMSIAPPWAQGIPLNADGFESYRYRKD